VDDRTYNLLQWSWPEDHVRRLSGAGEWRARSLGFCGSGGRVSLELTKHRGIVLLSKAAQEFESDDKEGDANARHSEHAIGGDMPGTRDEACVEM